MPAGHDIFASFGFLFLIDLLAVSLLPLAAKFANQAQGVVAICMVQEGAEPWHKSSSALVAASQFGKAHRQERALLDMLLWAPLPICDLRL